MSRPKGKDFHKSKNQFTDRQIHENESFPEMTVRCETIESLLLLLESEEDMILVGILKHLTEFIRKNERNVALLKENNLLELLRKRDFYRTSNNVIIRRFALNLAASIVESMNILLDMVTEKVLELVNACVQYFRGEADDFCLEYLSVVINKCLDDHVVAKAVLQETEYVEKLQTLQITSSNPDIILHSFEAMEKILRVQCLKDLREFIAHATFPTKRILCELTSEFLPIRRAALKVLRILILETSSETETPFSRYAHKLHLLYQLVKMLYDNLMADELHLVVEVMAAALKNEEIAQLFFEFDHFDHFMQFLNNDSTAFPILCKSLMVLTEAAKFEKYLPRLVTAEVTEKLLGCFIDQPETPTTHILLGLKRMMKSADACRRIVNAYDRKIIPRLIYVIVDVNWDIKTREQAAELLLNLLTFSFQKTAMELIESDISIAVAQVFGQQAQYQSTDLLLSLLSIVESLADNCDFREEICKNPALSSKLATLLMNSFASAVMVNSIFRCLSTLVPEEVVRTEILECFICSSIKRGLQSLSNSVKTSVTNFIMQTTRFRELVDAYLDQGVLEVLIMHQRHAFCVPTWGPAIDSILSKCPTLKFCIRNHLGFTDLTCGGDFYVSKQKFHDFRIFQSFFKHEVSPLMPVLVVNFERVEPPEENVVVVPTECFSVEESRLHLNAGGGAVRWCYCRTPGDPQLPLHLAEVNAKMEAAGLLETPVRAKDSVIDFTSIAKRAKIISQVVARVLGNELTPLDLNSTEECSQHAVKCHLRQLIHELHCTFIPLGRLTTGCQFERAVLFKALADQVGLPCTLQRSVDGRMLFNELPLPMQIEQDKHCHPQTMALMPWRMLSPTHIVDLMYNVGELYPIQSRQALQYLKLY